MSYKKRDKGNWNQGKSYKGSRKAKEREHVKEDIEQQIQEEHDENYQYRKYTHTRNKKASLEHSLQYYQEKLKTTQWSWYKNCCRGRIQQISEQLKKLRFKE